MYTTNCPSCRKFTEISNWDPHCPVFTQDCKHCNQPLKITLEPFPKFTASRVCKLRHQITHKMIKGFDENYAKELVQMGMKPDYSASLRDFILEYREKPGDYYNIILFTVLRKEFFSEQDLRLFAVRCAAEALYLTDSEACTKALDIAERYAFGEADEISRAKAFAEVRALPIKHGKPEDTAHFYSIKAVEGALRTNPEKAAIGASCEAADALGYAYLSTQGSDDYYKARNIRSKVIKVDHFNTALNMIKAKWRLVSAQG